MKPCPKCNKPDTMYGIKCYSCGYIRNIKIARADERNTRVSNPCLKYIRYRVTRKQSEAIFKKWQYSGAWRYKSYFSYRKVWHKDRETLMSNYHRIVIGIEPDGCMHS